MNETIKLMKRHVSVRNFKDEKIPAELIREMIEAGRHASSWKNFQSYSIIVVSSQEQKEAIYRYQPQQAIRECSHYLVFVGDLNRAKTAVLMRGGDFQPAGIESLLISAPDASLVAQNILLAAESLGYGGCMIGLIRDQSEEISDVLKLPDYTYPLFGLALGLPSKKNQIKPRLPYESVVFEEVYQVQDQKVIQAYDQIQADYAGDRQFSLWSHRQVKQWGQPEVPSSTKNLREKKLLDQRGGD